MTLDDAIAAFGQVASDDLDSIELDVRDFERLVEWLTELKLARESAFSDIGLAARAVSENHQLEAENAKLRALVRDYANVPCQCHRNGVACEYLDEGACTLYDRAISLGVEVD